MFALETNARVACFWPDDFYYPDPDLSARVVASLYAGSESGLFVVA